MYGVEKRTQVGIGRWYAKLEANRPKEEKVYDEKNNTYKVKSYTYDELVADDIRAIGEYNSQLHPNQKKYPGMTRWDVLCARQNPNLAPWGQSRALPLHRLPYRHHHPQQQLLLGAVQELHPARP